MKMRFGLYSQIIFSSVYLLNVAILSCLCKHDPVYRSMSQSYLILDSPFPRGMADLPAGCERWLLSHFPFSQNCIRNLNSVDRLSCNTWREYKNTALKFSTFKKLTAGEDSFSRWNACHVSMRINKSLNAPILWKTGGRLPVPIIPLLWPQNRRWRGEIF